MIHAVSPTTSKPDVSSLGNTSLEQSTEKASGITSTSIHESDIFTQTQKPFTTLSAIGIAYGVANAAVGIPLILTTTMPLGGSSQVFWAFLLMGVVALATATTLAELISAIPHPGGQFIWVNKLSPPRYRRGLSYATAMASWLGAISSGASGNLSVLLNIFAIVTLFRSSFVYQRWMGFVGYQVVNVVTCFGACFEHALPKMANMLLLFNILTAGGVVVTLFALAHTHTSAQDFFKLVNVSGWPNGVAFIIGCNGPNWCFSCMDTATHLAAEIPAPRTNIPRAMIWTVVVAASSGFLIVLAILVNLGPVDFTDCSGVAIFYRVTGNKAAVVGLWTPMLVSLFASVWSVQTWQSRLAWTVGQGSGFPLHRSFGKIFPAPFHTPIWSLIGSAVGSALFGFVYLASELAFGSLTATGILLQYFSYSVPAVLLLCKGRSKFQHGPFWYPRLGLVANLTMLAWTLVAFVFYCFPQYSVVLPNQMNYCSGVLVLIGIFITSLWFLYAKHNYKVIDV